MGESEVAGKLTFAQVRNQHHFGLLDLAKEAKVHTLVIYKMLLGESVKRRHADAVLSTLSKMANAQYDFDTVKVPIDDEQEDRQLL